MIIEPRVRGFICTTAHPVGCATNVREQIAYVLRQGSIAECPKRVAVLGCSTGYGLASRIVATFAGGAETIGVSLEREPTATRTGSAGLYNNRAFEIEARKIGRSPLTLEGDAFSNEMKENFIDAVRERFGQLDMLVYSMAAPVRTDPDTGQTYRSAIKPLGAPVQIKTLNTETGEVYETTISPASEDEAAATVAVMGGDDWKRWIDQLADAGVLAPGFRTLNYTYIGSELTWPIYWNGTLGRAKVDLDRKAERDPHPARSGCGARRGAEGRGYPGEFRDSGGAALRDGAVPGHEEARAARRLHRADRSPVPDHAWPRTPRSTKRCDYGSTIGSFRPRFKRKCCGDGRCFQRKRSANWRTLANTRASSCACSDLASRASTTRRTSIPASSRVSGCRLSFAWGCFRILRQRHPISTLPRVFRRAGMPGVHASSDIGVEGRPRRHHLEQPHREIQSRPDRDIGGGEIFAQDPRPFRQRGVEHIEYPLRVAPAGRHRVHFHLGRELHHRRLDAARRKKQPVEISCAQRIAERRRQLRLRMAFGDIGANRRGLRQRDVAVLERRHLAHRIDREILDALWAPVEISVSTRS